MDDLSTPEFGSAKSESFSIGNTSASSDEISVGFSFFDEISTDVPTQYDVRNEIYWKYKLLALPTIVITPPEESEHTDEIEIYVSCTAQIFTEPSVDTPGGPSLDKPVAPVPKKSEWKWGSRKRLWKRFKSLFTCCVPLRKCCCKNQEEGWLGPVLLQQMTLPH